MNDLIKNITDADFEKQVLQSDKLVIVDLWAPWCAPCKAIAPILEELVQNFPTQLQIVKINVDDNREVASKFGVRSIPTLLFFKQGQLVETSVGNVGKNIISEIINKHL